MKRSRRNHVPEIRCEAAVRSGSRGATPGNRDAPSRHPLIVSFDIPSNQQGPSLWF